MPHSPDYSSAALRETRPQNPSPSGASFSSASVDAPPKIQFACPMDFEAMPGSGCKRLCAQCGHRVTDFSALDAAQRRALALKAQTERVCITYHLRSNGTVVTPDAPLTAREHRNVRKVGALLSSAALALVAGCVSQSHAPKELGGQAASPSEQARVETPPPASAHAVGAAPEPSASAPAAPAAASAATATDDGEVIVLTGFWVDLVKEPKAPALRRKKQDVAKGVVEAGLPKL